MPSTEDRERVEQEVRAACERGDHAVGASAALRAYGPEIFGFLVAVLRDEDDAGDAFSSVSEVAWRKLPEFSWDSSLRTWLYAITRRVASTLRRDMGRRRKREAAAPASVVEEVAQAVRTQTLAYLRTERRTRLQELRDQLPEEDRMLLVLRVDRNLEWNELARVMGESAGDEPMPPDGLAREAARLRKRFQLVKDRLRAMAKSEGLIGDG